MTVSRTPASRDLGDERLRQRLSAKIGERLGGEDAQPSWRQRYFRYSSALYGPSRNTTLLSWIGDERVAIGNLPTSQTLPELPEHGVTHVINCRSTVQTWISQDLAAERALLGPDHVAHAPMWDFGQPQPPRLWSAAVRFGAEVLRCDPDAGLLIHCQQGRRRSAMLAYAVLRLRGHDPGQAAMLICRHRHEARLVGPYLTSVERWLVAGAATVGPLRIR